MISMVLNSKDNFTTFFLHLGTEIMYITDRSLAIFCSLCSTPLHQIPHSACMHIATKSKAKSKLQWQPLLFFYFFKKCNSLKEFEYQVFLLLFYLNKILQGIFLFFPRDQYSQKDSHCKPQGNFENVRSFLNGVKPTYSLFLISFDVEMGIFKKSSGNRNALFVILSIVTSPLVRDTARAFKGGGSILHDDFLLYGL